MQAGKLDRRIMLQHRTQSRDATSGQQVETWETYVTVWANRRDSNSREFFASQQTIAEGTAVFRLRYRDDVQATDRIICEGKTYNIRPPAEIGRREGLEIIATAVVR